jgi:hypothetical protein
MKHSQASPSAAPFLSGRRPISDKFTVKIESFKPHRSHSLYGFADLLIPEIRLRIKEATVHQSHERRWIGLPAKPQIDREGRVRQDDRGKTLYASVIQFTDRATSDAFSDRAVEALIESYPHAFDVEESAP